MDDHGFPANAVWPLVFRAKGLSESPFLPRSVPLRGGTKRLPVEFGLFSGVSVRTSNVRNDMVGNAFPANAVLSRCLRAGGNGFKVKMFFDCQLSINGKR